MKKLIILSIIILIGCGQNSNKVREMKLNWEVRSVRSYGFFDLGQMSKISEDDLKKEKHALIKDERLTDLFANAKYNQNLVLWKGGKLAFVDLEDGSSVKIAISNYGSYFHIVGQKGFYFFESPKNSDLWEYLFFGEGLKKSLRGSNPNSQA